MSPSFCPWRLAGLKSPCRSLVETSPPALVPLYRAAQAPPALAAAAEMRRGGVAATRRKGHCAGAVKWQMCAGGCPLSAESGSGRCPVLRLVLCSVLVLCALLPPAPSGRGLVWWCRVLCRVLVRSPRWLCPLLVLAFLAVSGGRVSWRSPLARFSGWFPGAPVVLGWPLFWRCFCVWVRPSVPLLPVSVALPLWFAGRRLVWRRRLSWLRRCGRPAPALRRG